MTRLLQSPDRSLPPREARLLDGVLRRSPLQALARRRSGDRLAVLAYHAIDDADGFRAQMRHLTDRMEPISLGDVVEARDGRTTLPDHAVLVTFDDGDRSVLDVAAPVLHESGVPGVACIVAGVLDSDEPFWWEEVVDLWQLGGRPARTSATDGPGLVRILKRAPDEGRQDTIETLRRTASSAAPRKKRLRADELRDLESAGIEVANHTYSHPCLSNCSNTAVESEIRTAHALLEAAVGHAPRAFAYPDGDEDVRAHVPLRKMGYDVAFMFDHRLTSSEVTDPMRMSRLRVSSHTSLDRFEIILSGLHPALHHALGRP